MYSDFAQFSKSVLKLDFILSEKPQQSENGALSLIDIATQNGSNVKALLDT